MFEGLDKVMIDSEDLEKVLDFSRKNKDLELGTDWFLPMSKGLVVLNYREEMAKIAYEFNFNEKEEHISISVYTLTKENPEFNELTKILFYHDGNSLKSEIVKGEEFIDKSMINLPLTTIMDVMFYMSNINKHKIYEVSEKSVLKRNKSNNKKSKKNNRVTYVKSKKYYISESSALRNNNTKRIKRIFSWSVRGHWRTYKKTGKTVWVNSYEKGNKNGEKKEKDYKLK